MYYVNCITETPLGARGEKVFVFQMHSFITRCATLFMLRKVLSTQQICIGNIPF